MKEALTAWLGQPSPLIIFFLFGGILFAIDSYFYTPSDTLVVDEQQIQRLAKLWQRQTGKRPEQKQLEGLVDNWIKEEIYYREALRLQLDKNDTIIRRRLVQKLNFISEEILPDKPEEVELVSFYEKNRKKYAIDKRYTFSQIFFKKSPSIDFPVILHQLNSSNSSVISGDPSMLNKHYALRTRKQTSSLFGNRFSLSLEKLPVNEWSGPIESSYGFHLVRLEELRSAEVPAYESVKNKVTLDYLSEMKNQARAEYYKAIKKRYKIVVSENYSSENLSSESTDS